MEQLEVELLKLKHQQQFPSSSTQPSATQPNAHSRAGAPHLTSPGGCFANSRTFSPAAAHQRRQGGGVSNYDSVSAKGSREDVGEELGMGAGEGKSGKGTRGGEGEGVMHGKGECSGVGGSGPLNDSDEDVVGNEADVGEIDSIARDLSRDLYAQMAHGQIDTQLDAETLARDLIRQAMCMPQLAVRVCVYVCARGDVYVCRIWFVRMRERPGVCIDDMPYIVERGRASERASERASGREPEKQRIREGDRQ